VTVFAIAIKPLHVHLDWLNSALYVAITLISIYIMLGLARHVGTFATGVFWLGVGLYFLQLVLYHWRYDEFYPDRQHLFGQLPATTTHVWLVAYLF
jgi:predicted membrane channel-forming protein YqfA (hemolysin III family)